MNHEDEERLRRWMRTGSLKEAREWLDKALEEAPEDDALHFWKGNLCRHTGQHSKALEHYAVATELNPESPARQARSMLMDILCFYDKERYNV